MTEINIPRQHEKYERLIAAAKTLPPLATAVVYPCDETSLKGAVEAAEAGLIKPILVGPKDKIHGVAQTFSLDLGGLEVIDVPHSHAAAEKAVSRASSRVVCYVIPTDEELMIARDALAVLRAQRNAA